MDNGEREQLATFMGHTSKTHNEWYRLPSDIYQTAKVSNILVMAQKNSIEHKGRKLDELDVDYTFVETVEKELHQEVPRGMVILIPNRDMFYNPDVDIISERDNNFTNNRGATNSGETSPDSDHDFEQSLPQVRVRTNQRNTVVSRRRVTNTEETNPDSDHDFEQSLQQVRVRANQRNTVVSRRRVTNTEETNPDSDHDFEKSLQVRVRANQRNTVVSRRRVTIEQNSDNSDGEVLSPIRRNNNTNLSPLTIVGSQSFQVTEELHQEVPRGMVILIPNRDMFYNPDVDIISERDNNFTNNRGATNSGETSPDSDHDFEQSLPQVRVRANQRNTVVSRRRVTNTEETNPDSDHDFEQSLQQVRVRANQRNTVVSRRRVTNTEETNPDSDHDFEKSLQVRVRANQRNTVVSRRRVTIEQNSDNSDGEVLSPIRRNNNTNLSPLTIVGSQSFQVTDSIESTTNSISITADIEYPVLPVNNEDSEVFPVIMRRENILEEMLQLYEDETIVQKMIKVTFENEQGLDFGGLTKELFSVFWEKCVLEFFRGENRMVPFLPLSKMRKGVDKKFPVIGRILTHGIILTKYIPTMLCKTVFLKLSSAETDIPNEILLEDFFFFLTPSERSLIFKAKNKFDQLTNIEQDLLLEFFATFGLAELPKASEIEDQLHIIARNILCLESNNFLKLIKDGIPLFCENFFEELSVNKVNALFAQQAPTPDKILKALKTDPEDLNNFQARVYYFFKTYIKNMSLNKLATFLQFITGSPHMPEFITISFKAGDYPVAHTCSNVLELPTTYSSSQELKFQFEANLENEICFQYSAL
ncbi:unnamed protein product [Brassicogethes aeneus]|uniref:HECT domain-containing protein n=1 Tax=Brassicogethes aeneus TaxID=1431903 RepID=A0A9P0FMI3_BRAAE|nr:unnamed protein product [Brassicogethes aeneus]